MTDQNPPLTRCGSVAPTAEYAMKPDQQAGCSLKPLMRPQEDGEIPSGMPGVARIVTQSFYQPSTRRRRRKGCGKEAAELAKDLDGRMKPDKLVGEKLSGWLSGVGAAGITLYVEFRRRAGGGG